ncbi:MAG TPA: DUF2917 domain-containing protein [Nitrospiria bacterium]|jgi:hypothetical protein|nr:DUF2917 domain-containing protein [Nitrospiria bacterium]
MRTNFESETTISPQEIRLSENAFWSVHGRSNEIEIECREGMVWITEEGDHRDLVLHAGQRFRNEKRGLIIVQALAGAKITVNGGRSG